MKHPLRPLRDNDTVVIIGCGPAGASCAIRLKKLSLELGINPRLVVYEGKHFEKKSYYNQCLGVLSPPLRDIMEHELEIPFPRHIIQREIGGYVIHTERNNLLLEGRHVLSYACRRVEFDYYLYEKSKECGVEVIPARVTDLDFLPDGVMVYSETNNTKADIVVGAFGLDDGMAKLFEGKTSYRQPRFLSSVVTKIHPGEDAMARFGNFIQAFLISSFPGIEFGAITPKGNHLSLNIAGKRVDAAMMDEFLRHSAVREVLPDEVRQSLPVLPYFKGKFPTLPARAPAGKRYIMVGDAAGFNRPFKGKGINSAVITGIRAAEALVHHGISLEALDRYLASCRDLTDDIPYGKSLRFLAIQYSRLGLLAGILKLAEKEPALKRALFNIVSGQETYRKTWRETRSFRLILRLARASLRGLLSRSL